MSSLKLSVPKKRNAKKSKDKILQEATHLFAQNGFAGTSLNDILERSKINKRMIYHYFDDKEGLYREVFINQWSILQDWFNEAFQKYLTENDPQNIPLKEIIMEALKIFMEFMETHMDFVRLINWESLEGGQISKSIWKEVRGPLYQQMEYFIQQAQQLGQLDCRLDASHLVVTFLGTVTFYYAHAASLDDIIGEDPLTAEAKQKRKDQVILMLEKLFQP